MTSKRLDALDLTRGALMVAILAGHAANNLDRSLPSTLLNIVLAPFFRLGTVGFALVSGILLGAFIATRADLSRILARYRRQGLRLFFGVHILIGCLLFGPMSGGDTLPYFLAARWYITDSLAVIFVLLVPFLPEVSARHRLIAGCLLLAIAKPLSHSFNLPYGPLLLLQDVLFGTDAQGLHVLLDSYALAKIAGVFLVGSAIGSRYGAAIERGDVVPFARRLIRISAILAIASIPLVAIWAMLRWHVAGAASYTLKYIFFPDRFFSLFPASIAAVLTFLAATILRLERGTPPGFVGRMLLILGKTSLFTYVIQYLFVETIPYSLGLQGAMGPTLYVVWTLVSCGLVFLAAEQWNRRVKKA